MEIVYAFWTPGPVEMVLIVLALLIVFGAGSWEGPWERDQGIQGSQRSPA